MIPTITVTPDPVNGNYCANTLYRATVDCPNAVSVEWFVQSSPDGFNDSDLVFQTPGSAETLFTVAYPGQWLISARCCELA
jgi:hypothetical protein